MKGPLPTTCFAGFQLSDCRDEGNLKDKKKLALTSYGPDGKTFFNTYCVQCCKISRSNPIAYEVWDMHCPYTMANKRIRESKNNPQVIRFARRASLDDTTMVDCVFHRSAFTNFVAGYHLKIQVKEMRENLGFTYWTSVVSCDVTVNETNARPEFFHEYIEITSIPTPGGFTTFHLVIGVVFSSLVVLCSIPCYKGRVKGQRCANCASWMVVLNGLCFVCILCGCRIHPRPVKTFCADDISDTSSNDSDSD